MTGGLYSQVVYFTCRSSCRAWLSCRDRPCINQRQEKKIKLLFSQSFNQKQVSVAVKPNPSLSLVYDSKR